MDRALRRRGTADPEPPWQRLALLVATLVLAVLIVLGLEWVHALNDPWEEPAERFALLQADVLFLGGIVVWAVLVLLLSLTGRFWLTAGLAVAGTVFVAFADFFKMQLRNEPLYPSDIGYLAEAALLVENVGAGRSVGLLAVLTAIVAGAWALSRSGRMRRRAPSGRRALALRVTSGTLAGIVVFSAVTFNQPGNLTRRAYEAAGVFWAPWSQLDNYAKNGFLAGVLYNLPATAMDRPAGYSAGTMKTLVARYTATAAAINASRDTEALADTNIVLVLGESTSDPTELAGITVSEDPLPFLRTLMADNTSGTMISSGYGGGTANVEFEVLTGLAMSNFQSQVHSAFQMLVAQRESFPSYLASLGAPERATLTLHPYVSSFYRREVVYPVFGFERSEFISEMQHTERWEADRHVSDAAVYAEVMDELRAADRPMLINAVLMQNHGPQTGYADPIPAEGSFSEAERNTIGQYLRGLKYSDDALAQLVADLDAFEERTIVLYYGDHLAPVWPQSVLDQNPRAAQYSTPWVVFANFDTFAVDPPTPIGPNYLVTQLLTAAGAPVTPFDALLIELSREIPAMETTLMLDPAGRTVEEDQLGPRASELLADYRLIQYDLTVGAGHAEAGLFTVPLAP